MLNDYVVPSVDLDLLVSGKTTAAYAGQSFYALAHVNGDKDVNRVKFGREGNAWTITVVDATNPTGLVFAGSTTTLAANRAVQMRLHIEGTLLQLYVSINGAAEALVASGTYAVRRGKVGLVATTPATFLFDKVAVL